MAKSWMVYWIGAGTSGPIKIGYTNKLKGRIEALQCSTWLDLRVILILPNLSEQQARQIERAMHKFFRHHHLKREWFSREILQSVHRLSEYDAIEWTQPELRLRRVI